MKNKGIISIVLLILILSSNVFAAWDKYSGENFGNLYGEIQGAKDLYMDEDSSWSKNIPSDSDLDSIFNLKDESSSYRSDFISEFRRYFRKAYEKTYDKDNFEKKDNSIDSGRFNGEYLGYLQGKIHGARDFYEGKSSDYLRNRPSDYKIINEYNLRREYEDYSNGFIKGFNSLYREGYQEAYKYSKDNIGFSKEAEAYESGKNKGSLKGEELAKRDFAEKKSNDWTRHEILSTSLTRENDLMDESAGYIKKFTSGYRDGFSNSYFLSYSKLEEDELKNSSSSRDVPLSGASLSSKDGYLNVSIPKGSYYNDVVLSIKKIADNKFSVDKNRYIKNSNFYSIEVGNPSQIANKDKLLTISFEYYGKNNGGIYKLVENKWIYLNSTVKDEKITTTIDPNTLNSQSNIYCVLIDKNNPLLKDVRLHWAKDEINALVRRDVIFGYGDETFKPEKEISRAEFLTLLSRIYNWKLDEELESIEVFKDYEEFGSRGKIIAYAISKGYIKGYEDNTFKANNPISYKEVEIILARTLNDPSFKWYNISARILYEKQVSSNSYRNMNNKISRSEVAYMLYILNQWKY